MLLESLKNSLHAVRDIQEYSTKEKTQPQKPENMKKLLTLYHKIRNNRIIVRTTHKEGNNQRWSIALNQFASQPSEESIIKRWIYVAWARMIWKPSGQKTHSCITPFHQLIGPLSLSRRWTMQRLFCPNWIALSLESHEYQRNAIRAWWWKNYYKMKSLSHTDPLSLTASSAVLSLITSSSQSNSAFPVKFELLVGSVDWLSVLHFIPIRT